MATSYAQWSVADLEKEKVRIEKAIERKSGRERTRVRAKVAALAKKNGFSLEDLVEQGTTAKPASTARRPGPKASKAKGKKVPPKYAHPSDSGLTWTGRGRTPLWIVEFEEAGKSRDQFLIK